MAQALAAEAEGREAARLRAKEKEKARKGRAKARKAEEALKALEALLSDTDASAEALEAAAPLPARPCGNRRPRPPFHALCRTFT